VLKQFASDANCDAVSASATFYPRGKKMDFSPVIQALIASNPDTDYIVISREINRSLHMDLSELIKRKKNASKCVVFLTTKGGDPHAGYRIGRCLRHNYPDQVKICVASYCKSAGTLIAICADELAIGDFGELGPLDVQVRKPSEFGEQSSGLDPFQALTVALEHARDAFRLTLIEMRRGAKVSTKLAGEFASQIAVGVVAPLYAQIDPNRAGELQRALEIAFAYGSRLDEYRENLREGALKRLTIEYPSHGFVIDRKEAKQLFHRVSDLATEEANFTQSIWQILQDENGFGPHMLRAPKKKPGPTSAKSKGNKGSVASKKSAVRKAKPKRRALPTPK
jgi:hypothetical protein